MWSPATGFPQNVFSPPFAPNLRLNLALLVANVPAASPRVPDSLSVSWRAARRFLNHRRLSTRALRSTWTRFGAFRLSSLVGELRDLANAGCLGYAPADYLFPHPTISTHAAVYSVPGAQFASHFVLINPCPLPRARRLQARWALFLIVDGGSGTTERCARTGSFERRCSRHPRQQLPPSPTSRTAGVPAGQSRARRSQVRAAIVDTEWQVRANTVWNRQIRSQLPVTAVPPPPVRGRSGGGGAGRSVLGCLGCWLMRGQGMRVCK